MYPSTTSTPDAGSTAAILAFLGAYLVVLLVIAVFYIVTMWKIFAKAGKPGWAAIIPIYNIVVLLEVVGRPVWWIVFYILVFVPIIDFIAIPIVIVLSIIVDLDLAKSFGKGSGFGVGIIFLSFIFLPILAFGSARYVGPAAKMAFQPVAPR